MRVGQLTDPEAAEVAQSVLESGEVLDRAVLIEGYAKLVKKATSWRFSLSSPVRNPDTRGHRYFLIHFCAHPDGYVHMANFMARVERTLEGLSGSDMLSLARPQLEFMTVNEHLAAGKRRENVTRIYDRLPALWAKRGWLKSRVQNRDLYAVIVEEFGWQVLRSEYEAALRRHAKEGRIRMASSRDDAYTEIR